MPTNTPNTGIAPAGLSPTPVSPLNGFGIINSMMNPNRNYFTPPTVTPPQLPKQLSPGFQNFQNFSNAAVNIITSPGQNLLQPALQKVGMPAGLAGVAGAVGDFAAPGPKGKTAAVGDVFRLVKVADLLKAKNVLTAGSERAGSVTYHMNQLANDRSTPINVRTLDDGAFFIEDGRHRLEAAKQLGLKELLIKDVTKEYKPRFQGKFVNPYQSNE